ncbi:DUF998 domain-containing protein [Herbiconiux daphne]|uniref:DUF998 domain-containing protein n=1 Tax=Herbiconiux daphne TaxID=2970914 RepID=A0ABT2H5G2_9MICO|nr:DUF998 domain-containing protein [Herbiconiux daphne]MCS5735138.1 DUF998 domain-containing protein [Herbiconiux daphne]
MPNTFALTALPATALAVTALPATALPVDAGLDVTMLHTGGLIALVAIAVTLISLIVLHLLPTKLSPLRDPVSQYGITRYRLGYAVAAWSAAVAGLGAIVALMTVPGSTVTIVLLAVFAVARAVIPAVPMDSPGAPTTRRGRMHNILAFAAFGTVTAAAFVAAGCLHDAGFAAASLWSTVMGVVMAVGAVGLLVARFVPALSGLFGAFERLIYVGFIAWFVALGVAFVS